MKNQTDALSCAFKFTHGRSTWPKVAGKEFVRVGDTIEKRVSGSISSGTIQTVEVQGLRGFADYIKTFSDSDFVINGTSPALDDGQPRVLTTVKKAVEGGITRTRPNFPFRDGIFKAFLDFDAPAVVAVPDWRTRLAALVTIYPAFGEVGFCVRPSASCGVYLEGGAEPMTRTGGERWDFLFQSGLDVERFVRDFSLRAWLAGFGAVKIDKGGSRHLIIKIDDVTEIDCSVFAAERIDFCGANPTRDGVCRKTWPPVFIDGELLEPMPALSVGEIARVESLQKTALDAAADEAAAIAEARRRELGKRVTSVAGKTVGRHVEETLKRQSEAKSASRNGYPIVWASAGQRLNFADLGEVDALDVLRDPTMFDGEVCDDPLEPEKGVKGLFYADRRQIFSFASHGYVMRLAKVQIVFNHEHPLDTMRAVDAVLGLGARLDLFERGGEIIKVSRDGRIKAVVRENLPIEVGRLVKFVEWREGRAGWTLVPCSPSISWWQAYAGRTDLGLPRLEGVRNCPFWFQGRLVSRAGYDAASGFFLTSSFDLDERKLAGATRETALAALSRFLFPFRHFPFVSEVDRLSFVAACLAAVQRPTLGNVPAFMIAARCAGTGKTLLAEALALLATGARVDATSFRADEAEMAKTLLAVLREGAPVVLFDNVSARFGGDDLCSILTSTVYRGRILGASKTASLPTNGAVFVATANNPGYQPDMPRRVIEIKLDARCERPHERRFDEDVLETVGKQRVSMLGDLLLIAAAFEKAGRPAVPTRSIGSFDTFVTEVVRPLAWLTGVDVADAMPEATSDADTELLGELLSEWHESVGLRRVTLSEALEVIEFRRWAAENFSDARATVNSQRLGKFLQKSAGRIVGGRTLCRGGMVKGRATWQVETL